MDATGPLDNKGQEEGPGREDPEKRVVETLDIRFRALIHEGMIWQLLLPDLLAMARFGGRDTVCRPDLRSGDGSFVLSLGTSDPPFLVNWLRLQFHSSPKP